MLSEIHFDERFGFNNYTISKTYLWTLGLIGLFMILIACINFVNLATAKAISRSKEIGMRKILGSSKKDIITQFMSESFLLASIAGIGLIGLAAFSSVKRFKEIGVRKVLGATVSNILFLMSKEFIVLALIGFFISVPIAFYLASGWLEGFAYSIDIEWWMVTAGGGIDINIDLNNSLFTECKSGIYESNSEFAE